MEESIMKKFVSALLGAAIAVSMLPSGVFAEAGSESYAIDAQTKTVSQVAPLTKVADFKSSITGADVEVVNVDGSTMADDAYATENVFAKIDGELYKIETKALYQPIRDKGDSLADGAVLYSLAANELTGDTLNSSFGFNRIGLFGKFGTGKDNAAPANTADQTLKATKTTSGGETVYRIENNSNNYAFVRTHAGYKTSVDTDLRKATQNYGYAVTSYSFKADRLGNISVFHNMPTFDGSNACSNYDAPMSALIGYGRTRYAGNALHFTEDGKIMVGGNYENDTADNRKPYFTVGSWTAGTEYNVSIVQKANTQNREHRVAGIYINGEKVFPLPEHTGDGNGLAYQTDGTYRMYGYSSPYYPGISSVFFATAPKAAGENFTIDLSDFEIYGLGSAEAFDAAVTKQNISLSDAENVTVTENNGENKPALTLAAAETAGGLKAKYPGVIMGIYNADGTLAADADSIETGMTAKIASADGLQGKTYAITAPVSETVPESTVYTVDTAAKTVSGVAPLTKVSDFLNNFENGSLMQVVNIDGSEMSADAFATENVSLKAPDGDIYKIAVKYAYSPIQTSGDELADGDVIYNMAANEIDNSDITSGGFVKLQQYAKIGYGSDNAAPENTAEQTAKASKQTENGDTVYVMENDSNNYAYLRSHYSESSRYSTTLNSAIDSWTTKPIVTSVEFEADKLGNISVFNNTPVRDRNQAIIKGDSGIDMLVYGVELPFVPNSVHFLEDGSVKLGGIYSNYTSAYRNPSQETDFRWQPGKKYTVSIVQRYRRGKREAYVDGVYVNGEKIFPNAKTVSHTDGRVALTADGTFKIGSKSSDYTHGGGLSSVMIGTAPKTPGENLTVSLSDVKVYSADAYNASKDADIVLTAKNSTVFVDNDSAVIRCVGGISAGDFETSAKLKVESGYVKAVSQDGLSAKTYEIVREDIQKGFFDADGNAIERLADAAGSVTFAVNVNAASLLDNTSPVVVAAVYDRQNTLKECVVSGGTKYSDEVTCYKAVIDISEYNKDNIEIRGFVWNGFGGMRPLEATTELR